MGQYTINIGDAANDGLGDTIRAGFEAVNAMFAELYGASKTITLEFDDVTNPANIPVADVNSLSDWNAFLDFPNFGVPFTAVSVDGNSVTLTGRSGSILKDSLFRRNAHIISITDTGVFRYISDFAFSNSALITGTFNDVVYAGYYAFGDYDEGGSSLTEITGAKFTTAGNNCFYGCTSLTSTGSVTIAGFGCFAGCTSLTSIDNVTTAGESCFAGCTSLTSTGSVVTAGEYCFYGCTSLTSTGSVTTAGESCFNGCTSLTTTGSVTTAGNYCFNGCTSLTSTGSVVTAGEYCFQGCTSLTSIDNVTTAGSNCFAGCTSLTSTGSVTTAGDSCFAGCTSLINIDLSNYIAPTIGNTTGEDNVFYGIAGNAVINLTVPSYLMTNNVGNPDGDIQYLIDNNTLVNITQV